MFSDRILAVLFLTACLYPAGVLAQDTDGDESTLRDIIEADEQIEATHREHRSRDPLARKTPLMSMLGLRQVIEEGVLPEFVA